MNCPYPQIHVLNVKAEYLLSFFSHLAVIGCRKCTTTKNKPYHTELCLREFYFKSPFYLSFLSAVLCVILFLPLHAQLGYDNSTPASFLCVEVCFSLYLMQSHRKLSTACQRQKELEGTSAQPNLILIPDKLNVSLGCDFVY